MINTILNLLKNINDNYSQLILVFLAIMSVSFAYNEVILKRRPYVLPELAAEQNEKGEWHFIVALVNKGEKPGIAHISKAILKVGDDKYPTLFDLNTVLAPNERVKLFPIGHINQFGIENIKQAKFSSNTVEIYLEIESKAIGDKEFKYKTTEEYFVDVTGDKPFVRLLKEDFE